nr:substrate-binding domain-containing protein [Nocardiopsis sp. CC223A]
MLLGAATAVVVALIVAIGAVLVDRFVGGATVVEGVVGSEKVDFFRDEEVMARLAELGYEVRVRPRGSRLLAQDAGDADFVSPGSDAGTDHVQRQHGVSTEHRLFSTPMVVLSYEPLAESLREAGVAHRSEEDGTWSFDLAAYLELTAEQTRWRDLPGDSVGSENRNEVLVRTTDPRTSNSGGLYAAVISYLLNGEEVVPPGGPDPEITDRLSDLFLAQGQPPESSQQPFEQFRDLGPGHTPLLWAYEAQYVHAMVNGPALPDDVVLMYPAPTVYSAHTLVPLTEAGDAVGALLAVDPELRSLATRHGFRAEGGDAFAELVAEHDLPVRDRVDDIVNIPTYEALEALLNGIEDAYDDSGMGPPAPEEQRPAAGPSREEDE